MNRRLAGLVVLMLCVLGGGLWLGDQGASEADIVEASTARRSVQPAAPVSGENGEAAVNARNIPANLPKQAGQPDRGRESASAADPSSAASSGGNSLPRSALRTRVDLFPAPPAPRPVASAAVAVPPPAPPPPRPGFAYIGRVLDGSDPMAVVRDAASVQTLRNGDRLGGWRVVAVVEDALSLVHESTGTETRLRLGAAGPRAPERPALVAAGADDREGQDGDGVRREQ